jgi:hypothetical protein
MEETAIDPEPPFFYANHAQIHAGPYDIVLDLGRMIPNEGPRTELQLAMSWEHAKALAELISGAAATVEGQLDAAFPKMTSDHAAALEKLAKDKEVKP